MQARIKILLFFFAVLSLSSSDLYSQMFSIGENKESNQFNSRFQGFNQFYFSVSPTTLTYTGTPRLSLPGRFIPLDFNSQVVHFGYESLYTNIQFGYGGNLTGLPNNTDFLSIHFKNLRSLLSFGNQKSRAFIPIGLTIDYTRIGDTRSLELGNNLNQTGFMVGSGFRYMSELKKVIFLIGFDGFYGLSFADGSAFRGRTAHLNAPIRLMIKDVINTIDLSFGFTYQFKQFDITNDDFERFDYDLDHSQFTLGLRF